MIDKLNDQSCPKCGGSKCVVGYLHLGDSDTNVDGSFHPIYIKTALIIRVRPSAKILDDQCFHACAECGLMWNKIDASELMKSVAEHDWEPGQPQIASPSVVRHVPWFLALVITGLIGAIIFFKTNA